MNNYYREIPGWFDFEDIYDIAVERAIDGNIFVEVGCWLGKSTAYLGSKIKESGKNITLYAVDTWAGSVNEPEHQNYIQQIGGNDKLYEKFIENMCKSEVNDIVVAHRGSSTDIVNLFENESLSLVFIDASHDYISVLQDIYAWWPKIIKDGILAGHDHPWPDVNKAVKEMFQEDYKVMKHSWIKYK